MYIRERLRLLGDLDRERLRSLRLRSRDRVRDLRRRSPPRSPPRSLPAPAPPPPPRSRSRCSSRPECRTLTSGPPLRVPPRPPPNLLGSHPLTVLALSTSTSTLRPSIFLPSACLYAAVSQKSRETLTFKFVFLKREKSLKGK